MTFRSREWYEIDENDKINIFQCSNFEQYLLISIQKCRAQIYVNDPLNNKINRLAQLVKRFFFFLFAKFNSDG